MSKSTFCRSVALVLPLFIGLIVGSGPAVGQEPAAAPASRTTEKVDKKSSGRLPPYYGQVVTKEQREKIYAVQAKYAEQIEKLLTQLESLEQTQKQEIEAVLSPEQREQVMKLVSDARSKRSKRPGAAPADAAK